MLLIKFYKGNNMKEKEYRLKVMEHYKNGGQVEYIHKYNPQAKWSYISKPKWVWECFDYRIKTKE